MNPSEEVYQFKDAKYCFVPSCKNNSQKNKEKMFFMVPSSAKQDWCEAVGAHCPKRNLNICEDHLNLKEDVENYMYWTTMKSRPKLKRSLPHSLQPNISQLSNEPQPSTSSSCIPMEIDIVDKDKSVLCHKSVQVKPKTADRTTYCSLHKLERKAVSHCQGDSDFLSESIDFDDAIPSTQGSTTSADVSELSSEVLKQTQNKNFILEIVQKRPHDYLGLPQDYYLETNLKLESINIIITL